jgi:spore maturation protein SpmA
MPETVSNPGAASNAGRALFPPRQDSLFDSARSAVDLVIGLVGAMIFFLGLMRVAFEGGLSSDMSLDRIRSSAWRPWRRSREPVE